MSRSLSSANPFWLQHINEFALPLHFVRQLPSEYLEALSEGLTHQRNQALNQAKISLQKAQSLLNPPFSDGGFARHLELLFCWEDKSSPEFLEAFRQNLEESPSCAEYIYNRGLLSLQKGKIQEAFEDFKQAVSLSPSLKEAHKALGVMYTLLEQWKEAEESILLGTEGQLDNGLWDLCLFTSQFQQGKDTLPLFQVDPVLKERNFPIFSQDLFAEALSYLPPINLHTLKHPNAGPYILFFACDRDYFYDHGLALLGSLAALQKPVHVHLHLFNPDAQVFSMVESLQERLLPVVLKTSFETVNLSYYNVAPGVYYSSVRFCRLQQLIQENTVPVVMIDTDSLVRKDLSSLPGLLDPHKEVGFCYLKEEPLWNQMAAGIFYAKPTPGAGTFLSFLSCFIIKNLQKGTARWFLDQMGLALGWQQLKDQVSFQFLDPKEYLNTDYHVDSLLWTVVNNQKTEASPYNTLKEALLTQWAEVLPRREEPFNSIQNAKYGWVVYNIHDQFIGQSIRGSGTWCDHEIQGLANFIQPGATVLDVGANIGSHTLAFARLVGPQGHVLSFEAQPLIFQNLVATVALNSLERVRCYQVAVGESMGEMFIPLLDPRQENQNFGGVSMKIPHLPMVPQEKVPLITIDSLKLEACHLIKIDVEGMEEEVLKGAHQTIQRFSPVLYLENHEGVQNRFVSLLTQWGYKIYKHGTEQDPNNLCVPPHVTIEEGSLERVA